MTTTNETPDMEAEAVAWRCKDYADGWIIFRSINGAKAYQEETGCLMQPLFATPPKAPIDAGVVTDAMVEAAYDAYVLNLEEVRPRVDRNEYRLRKPAITAAITAALAAAPQSEDKP